MPSKKTAAKTAAKTSAKSRTKTAAKADAKPAKQDWMSRIKESSHDVFLAGLASLARARAPAKRSGKADFETLVAEGRKLEPDFKGSVQKTWDGLREKSRGTLPFKPDGKLQEIMEGRVATALASLGVPSRKDFDALSARVDSLMAASTKTRRTAGAGRKAVRRSAAGETTEPK